MYISGGPSWRPATTAELMMRLPTRYLGSRNPARASRATFRRCGAAFRRPFRAKRGAMPKQRESCIRPRRGPRRCTVSSSARVPLRSCPGVRLRACASATDRNVRTARGRSSGEMERDGEYKGVRCAVCRAGVGRWARGVTVEGKEMTERHESLHGGLPLVPAQYCRRGTRAYTGTSSLAAHDRAETLPPAARVTYVGERIMPSQDSNPKDRRKANTNVSAVPLESEG